MALDRNEVRDLHRQACHGAGAEARDRLGAIAERHDLTVGEVLDTFGLDQGAYFASKPISRPARP